MLKSYLKWRGAASSVMTAALSLSSTAAIAAEEPLILQPTSQWQLDYADDSCRLARQFGEGEQEVTLLLTRYSPSSSFDIVLVGEIMNSLPAKGEAEIQFGDHEEAQKLRFFDGTQGETPAMITAGSLHELTKEEIKDLVDREEPYTRFEEEDRARDLARAAEVEYIWIDAPRLDPIRLETGSLGKPFKAFEGCIDELVHHWGVDVDRYKKRISGPAPKGSPGRWVTSADYPRDLLRQGGQGIVHFRLSVDAEGNVSECHIQGATEGDGFQEVTCKSITKRAKFEPALDADGAPMASYYISSVRFEIPS